MTTPKKKRPPKRGPRPRTKHFSAQHVMEAWEPTGVAKYIVYKKPLDKLVDFANTGFPAHDLAAANGAMQKKYKYFGPLDPEKYKKTMNTCVYLKKQGCENDELRSVVDKIVLPASGASITGSEEDAKSGVPDLSLDDVLNMFKSGGGEENGDMSVCSSSDVEISMVTCRCERCTCREAIAIPSCEKGGQRKETSAVPKPKHRLSAKTTVKPQPPATHSSRKRRKRNKHFLNAIVHPVKVVKLNNFCGKSAYILGADKAHIVSASERVHGDRFIQGIEFVEKEIGKKRVRTNVEAKRVLASFLSANVF